MEVPQTVREKIWGLVEPVILSEGLELVEIEYVPGKARGFLRLFIDKEDGITVDDCALISREVGDVLDVHGVPAGAYTLEVSSPGIDRPLVRDRDFLRYTGHVVKIRLVEMLEGRKHFRGTLVEYCDVENGKCLVLDCDGKEYRIPREIIAKAKLYNAF